MQKRAESGPMAFGDDWTGLFLRGDEAASMALILQAFIESAESGDKPCPLDAGILRAFAEKLSKCDERTQGAEVQLLLPFEECLMTRSTVICPPPPV